MGKIYTPATKSMNPWDVDDNRGWDIVGATPPDERSLVPVVADCIDERGKGLADLPFVIYDERGKEVDNSDNYQNAVGFLPNPHQFLWLTGASLAMGGRAYWHMARNTVTPKELTYWAFDAVKPIINDKLPIQQALQGFERTGGKKYPVEDVLYFWLPDPKVELGPPTSYPLIRALKAAGALLSISDFVANYMSSGMVKAFIAQSDTPPANPEERDQMEDYLTRILTGVKKTLSRIRVIKKSISVQPIGGGLDELKDVGIVKEIKQDVLEAFGVPASRVWGNAANYATAANDTIVFVTSEIMPDARIVQNAINTQALAGRGWRWEFQPRRMEEFSAIVGEKTGTIKGLFDVLSAALPKATALKMAIDIAGLDMSKESAARIEQAIRDENKPVEIQPPAAPIAPAEPEQPEPAQEPPADEIPPAMRKALVELDKWKLKSEKAGKLVTWHAVDLPVSVMDAVKSGMSWDDAREAVKSPAPEPVKSPDDAAHVLRGLELAVKALEPVAVQPAPITVNLTAQMPAVGEPSVTINVPAQPAPQVTVNVPEQPAPQVSVTNNVQPTPVTVQNQVDVQPAPATVMQDGRAKRINIKRDNEGRIIGAESV